MAAGYVNSVRLVQADGPYHLAGWSFGGLLAFEMAVQLQAAGQKVAWIALFDTFAPGNHPEKQYDDFELLALFAKEAGWPTTEDELRKLGRTAALVHLTKLAAAAGDLSDEMGASFLGRRLEVFQANSLAERSYMPALQPITIHLVRATQRDEERVSALHQDPYLGWRQFTDQEIHLHSANGRHLELMKRPAVRDIAKILRDLLNPRPSTEC